MKEGLTVDISETPTGYRITIPGMLYEDEVLMDHYRVVMGKLKAVEFLLAAIDALQGTTNLTGPVDADTRITRSL